MRIALIAPWNPKKPGHNLGAEKKIELLVNIFLETGFEIILIDSSHSEMLYSGAIYGEKVELSKGIIEYCRPFLLANRKIGKFANSIFMNGMVEYLVGKQIDCVWMYNAYLYEARLFYLLKTKYGIPGILELEDTPLARGRGINPKPYLDFLYFKKIKKIVNGVTCVNQVLESYFQLKKDNIVLFPSCLDNGLDEIRKRERFSGESITVGYFGGLSIEKGADKFLDVFYSSPENIRFIVTGSGALHSDFLQIKQKNPEKMNYLGRVDSLTLLEAMKACDVIVNPHSPVCEMGNGVYPFKVCEAIASGALLVTTKLPSIGFDFKTASIEYDGSTAGLLEAILKSRDFYFQNKKAVNKLCQDVFNAFSVLSIKEKITALLYRVVNEK